MEARQGKRRAGRKPMLGERELEAVRAVVEARPDIGLRALVDVMAERTGKRLSTTTWAKALRRLGYSKPRATRQAAEASAAEPARPTRYRAVHRREPGAGRYPSSLTDLEWETLRPLVERTGGRGRPSVHDRRVMWDAVFYLVRAGCSWRMLPAGFPAYKAVFAFFARARASGLLDRTYTHLHALWRERSGRQGLPSAGVVDSQSAKTAEKGGSAASTRARR